MTTIEQVEKLLEYADVLFEEARDALDACGGNLLDAVVYLERRGKVSPRGNGGSVTVLPGNAQEKKDYKEPAGEDFSDSVNRFFKWIGEQFDNMSQRVFTASHRDYEIISVPAVIFWCIAIFGFYFVLPALLVGAICGVSYRFEERDKTEKPRNPNESEKL